MSVREQSTHLSSASSMLQEVMLNRLYYGFAAANLPLVIAELVAVIISWDNVNK